MNEISFLTIKEIAGYDVTFMKIHNWVTAYVRLINIPEEHNLQNVTYHEGDVFGIDTAHGWNENQSFEEKQNDAERQIEQLIFSARK